MVLEAGDLQSCWGGLAWWPCSGGPRCPLAMAASFQSLSPSAWRPPWSCLFSPLLSQWTRAHPLQQELIFITSAETLLPNEAGGGVLPHSRQAVAGTPRGPGQGSRPCRPSLPFCRLRTAISPPWDSVKIRGDDRCSNPCGNVKGSREVEPDRSECLQQEGRPAADLGMPGAQPSTAACSGGWPRPSSHSQ